MNTDDTSLIGTKTIKLRLRRLGGVLANLENIAYKDLYFDLNIQPSCFSTWNLPSATSSDTYTSGEYVIDLGSSYLITITWTGDDT